MRKLFQAAERQASLTVGVRIPALLTRIDAMLPSDRDRGLEDAVVFSVALAGTVVSIVAGCF